MECWLMKYKLRGDLAVVCTAAGCMFSGLIDWAGFNVSTNTVYVIVPPLQNKVRQSCLLSSRTRGVELSPAVRLVSRYCQTVQTITENSLLPVAFRSYLTMLLQFLTQFLFYTHFITIVMPPGPVSCIGGTKYPHCIVLYCIGYMGDGMFSGICLHVYMCVLWCPSTMPISHTVTLVIQFCMPKECHVISVLNSSMFRLFYCFFSAMHYWECVAPNVDISLQSGRFWATSVASFRERLLDFRFYWIVFIHVVRRRPGGLLLFSKVKLLRFLGICLVWWGRSAYVNLSWTCVACCSLTQLLCIEVGHISTQFTRCLSASAVCESLNVFTFLTDSLSTGPAMKRLSLNSQLGGMAPLFLDQRQAVYCGMVWQVSKWQQWKRCGDTD